MHRNTNPRHSLMKYIPFPAPYLHSTFTAVISTLGNIETSVVSPENWGKQSKITF